MGVTTNDTPKPDRCALTFGVSPRSRSAQFERCFLTLLGSIRTFTVDSSPERCDLFLDLGELRFPRLELTRQCRARLTHTDGNVWGFARGKQVSVSPLSPMPDRTLIHELAHVVLGHTVEAIEQDGPRTPRNIREVEAEGVAFICASALELEGAEYSRGYLQHWLCGQEIPERSCQRIFKAADAILRAGREVAQEGL